MASSERRIPDTTAVSEVELVVALEAELGEAPLWDAETASLLQVDILRNRVYQIGPGRETTMTVLPQEVSAILPRLGGGFVAVVRDGVATIDLQNGRFDLKASIEGENRAIRMNDAKCDPTGRLWAGSMRWDAGGGGGCLYVVDETWNVAEVISSVSISNGLGWSPDGTTMYYVDTPTNRVDALDFDRDSGDVANRRCFVDLADFAGSPDGLTVDADGGLWIAMWGGHSVLQVDASGNVVGRVPLAVSQVTSCAFGGPGLEDLYITSARCGLGPSRLADEPLAGGTFRCRPGVTGMKPESFRG